MSKLFIDKFAIVDSNTKYIYVFYVPLILGIINSLCSDRKDKTMLWWYMFILRNYVLYLFWTIKWCQSPCLYSLCYECFSLLINCKGKKECIKGKVKYEIHALFGSSKDDPSQLSLVKMTHPENFFIVLVIDNINITNDIKR